ncbi:TLDc domain-containing protein [Entamoeba marina]
MSTNQTFIEKFNTNESFDQLTRNLNDFLAMLNEVRGTTEYDPRIVRILNESNQPLNGTDEEVLKKYETWYDQLAEYSINKEKVLKNFQDNIILIQNAAKQILKMNNILDSEERIGEIILKETLMKDRINFILNSFVDKIIEKTKIINDKKIERKKIIYDKEVFDLGNELRKKYDTIEVIYEKDPEVRNLSPFDKLREWSKKQNCSVLFDSKIDGDGGNDVLLNKVINKRNLYFISFDNENNVFGGYVDTIINKTNSFITDPNAFTFSLMRNNDKKNNKYEIKNNNQQYAFYLFSNKDDMYGFGGGNAIHVGKINNSNSYCTSYSFEYTGDQHPFVDKNYPTQFAMKRILVIQMS